MTTQTKRHPFLDDLAEDVVLNSSILRRSAHGRDKVLRIFKSGASQYAKQNPTFLGDIQDRTYFEYEVTLHNGISGTGLVSIKRTPEGSVTSLEICFSPLDLVLAMANGAREQLAPEFDSGLFIHSGLFI